MRIAYLTLPLLIFAWPFHTISDMTTYAYHTELFAKEPVPTEYTAYQVLKVKPLEQNINYLAMPWTIVMRQKNIEGILPELKLNGGFTICQHFRFEEIIPIIRRIGINVLFTPHIEEQKNYEGITVLPFPHFAQNGTQAANHKDVLYSFVGAESKQTVRAAIFRLPKHKDVKIIKRKGWGARTTEKQQNKEYRNILARSRYALCPRGHGASTIRFWEALQAGAIPVVLADSMMLPDEIDWSSCIIRIPEKDIIRVNEVIRNIPIEQEETMRKNCLIAYELSANENLVRTIHCYYQQYTQQLTKNSCCMQ